MYIYYCKNCNNIIAKWYKKEHSILDYCNYARSKNINSIYFLDCENCDKFVGILCYNVCKNCFGKIEIYGEENLLNWFLKYKKTQFNYLFNNCDICDKDKFRYQYWFFQELTFHEQKYA